MIAYETNNELMHYGVLGMKWGAHRALSKSNKRYSLNKKALKYDKKAAKFEKKSEKAHSEYDLKRSNKASIKAAKYDKKAAKKLKKALDEEDETKRLSLEKKGEKLKYKAAKQRIDGNRLSRSVGYGQEAMKYAVKSDIAKKKAQKARYKLAKNNAYIAMTKRKISSLPKETIEKGSEYVTRLMEV